MEEQKPVSLAVVTFANVTLGGWLLDQQKNGLIEVPIQRAMDVQDGVFRTLRDLNWNAMARLMQRMGASGTEEEIEAALQVVAQQ